VGRHWALIPGRASALIDRRDIFACHTMVNDPAFPAAYSWITEN
jgi:hypothetical protein